MHPVCDHRQTTYQGTVDSDAVKAFFSRQGPRQNCQGSESWERGEARPGRVSNLEAEARQTETEARPRQSP